MIIAIARSRFVVMIAAALILFQLLLSQTGATAVTQPDSDDGTHDLLEKSLSLVEIDKEIARIRQQKAELAVTLSETEQQLLIQEERIADKREQAGRVLRAYYMGDRDFLLSALVSSDSLSKLLQIIDYIEIIYSSDKQALYTYAEQYKELQESIKGLETQSSELIVLEERLQLQKQRVIELEKQLEDQLSGRTDADRLRLLMKELTSYWESAGMEEVKTYFNALAEAMQQLPAWVQDNPDMMDISGFKYTITVSETELNSFLVEQNDLFKHFSFKFADNKVTAIGKRDDIEISVTGYYTLQEKPTNGIIFHVEELLFNGFALPDTTRKELEQQYDLGFYPGMIISFVKAKSVEIKEGKMIIQLSLSL